MSGRQCQYVPEDDFMVTWQLKVAVSQCNQRELSLRQQTARGTGRSWRSGSGAKYTRAMKRTKVWWSENRKARASGQLMLWDKGVQWGRSDVSQTGKQMHSLCSPAVETACNDLICICSLTLWQPPLSKRGLQRVTAKELWGKHQILKEMGIYLCCPEDK